MTTVKIRTGNGIKIVSVNQTRGELLLMASLTPRNHTMVYTPFYWHNGERIEADGRYDPETNIVYSTGGRFYVGLGAALGWETTAQIGPDHRFFEVVS